MNLRFTSRIAPCLILLCLPGLGQAPDGPYWTTIPVPAGFQSVTNIGTTGTINATGSVTFYSSILHTFTPVALGPTAVVGSFNDYSMVKEPTSVTAYCSRTGVASTLNVSPTATLTNGPVTSTWTSVVVDGTQAFGYGAFVGSWAPLTLAAPNPTIAAGNNCLLIWDGTQLHALSSLTSAWTSITPSEPIVGLAAGGFVGLAWGATTVYGFTNHRQSWASTPFVVTSAPILRDNFAVFDSGLDHLFYSAITETFAQYTASSVVGTLSGQNVAMIQDGSTIQVYASPKGVLVPVPVSAPTVTINSEWLVIADGGSLTAFSGVTGAFATPLSGAVMAGGNEDVAYATTPTANHAYSPLQNAWFAAPPGTPTSVQFIRNGVILVTPTGYDGFCTRTGTWSSIATNVQGTFQTLSNSATFCALDGNSMSIFDSRLGRWNTIATAAPPSISIWRFTLLAHDFTTAYGFGMTNDVWEPFPLASPPVAMVANDSIGYVRTATSIHFYSALGSLSTVSRYPEFSRMQARGSGLRYMQTGPAGSLAAMVVGTAGDFIPLPPLGTLFVNPATIWAILDLPPIPPSGVLDFAIPVPNDPALNDVPIYLQGVIAPPAAPLYLTNSMSPIIM